ncbi:MAG TPA: hypothetical protein VND21_05015, partial [Planctomycetota bacterium]|nr:hypothetical protein [Planctomycetota bacterium]
MPVHQVALDIGGRTLILETGRLALLAAGSATVRLGDTIVLSGASTGTPREGIDFFPLTIDYREKTYASGKIPGGFMKREGPPTPREILTMRMTDRPIRPLWPDGFKDDVQVQTFVVSFDQENDPDVLSVIASSAALSVSKMPFLGPLGAVRIGMRGDEFVAFPDAKTMAASPLDLVVAGTKNAVTMVEAGASELAEEVMLEAVYFGHDVIKRICEAIEELRRKIGWVPVAFEPKPVDPAAVKAVRAQFGEALKTALHRPTKLERQAALRTTGKSIKEALAELGADGLDGRRVHGLGLEGDGDPADLPAQLLDRLADALDHLVAEVDGLEHHLLGELGGAGLDHRDR